ncbi:MAG: adenosylcobinamide amidohydrolase [Rhodospirillales bacterium]
MVRSAKSLWTPFSVEERPGWLLLSFEQTQRMLSWALSRPGFQDADQIAWVQVRNSDLTPAVDAAAFLHTRLKENGAPDAIGLMTSGELRYQCTTAIRGDVAAACVVTLGLSNAERVGQRSGVPRDGSSRSGTINMACHVSIPLSDAALLESISIATQARTVAIVEFGHQRTPTSGVVTGTGTDCIVACCPRDVPTEPFAGLHTPVGESIGAAVYEATQRAMREWIRRHQDPNV